MAVCSFFGLYNPPVYPARFRVLDWGIPSGPLNEYCFLRELEQRIAALEYERLCQLADDIEQETPEWYRGL